MFLLSISLMLLFAKILGEFFVKLNQPAIIGEIIAGIILGPTVLGMLSPDIFSSLFPQTGELRAAMDGIISLAVIMLLLVSGLEVDLSVVIANRKSALFTSFFGILFPFVLGFGISFYFPDLMGGAVEEKRFVFALFIGTAIAISSLPVIVKILMDLQIFKSQVGFIIISAAMLNDLIGWLVFSVILGMMGAGAHNFSFETTLIFSAVFVILIMLPGRYFLNKAIKIIQEKFTFPGGILNFILIMGFLGAAFTEYIGIHSILGAFIIGIAIGDSVHLKEQTREIIQQFITNIFAPLFFVSIGLRVNFIESFDLFTVSLLLLLAVIGKVLGSSLGARLSGLAKNYSLAVGFGMSSSGAMGIILGLIALDFGLIQNTLFVGLVITALFTSIISAPAMKHFLAERLTFSLNALLNSGNIIFSESNSKSDLIKEMVNSISKQLPLPTEEVISEVLKREEELPTGIQNCLAVPHAKLNIPKPVIAVAINKNGIDFSAADGEISKVIFLLLSPASRNELQLQLLAEIVQKFKDRKVVDDLLELKDKEKIVKYLRKI